MAAYRYRRKHMVEAERWIGTKESEREIKNLGALVELQEETGHLFVSTKFGVALAPIGYWVVRDESHVSVWSPLDFENEFEKAQL